MGEKRRMHECVEDVCVILCVTDDAVASVAAFVCVRQSDFEKGACSCMTRAARKEVFGVI